jgi:hypothetical protein
MAYENIDKLKVYMQKKIDAIVTGEQVKFSINAHQLLDEMSEMEGKAKAFDEILNIYLDQHEIIVHGQVEDIVNKYTEDK